MSIEEVVDVQISIQDVAVTRAGFGIGLIVGSSGKLVGKTQVFANITAVSDVFTSGDPELTMATAYFGQDLKPEKVIIAQRDPDVAQEDKILITALQNDTLYSVTIAIDGGVAVQHDFTSDSDATRAEIVTGLIAAINGSSQATLLTLTDNGDDFDILSGTAGDALNITVTVNMTVQAITANRNVSTELALIQADDDTWFELLTTDHTDKNVKRAAAFIQARKKIYGTASQNADIISPEKHVFTLDFDADFVTSNLIDLTIDGIPVTQTPFDTDQSTTLNNLAINILAHARVSAATSTGPRQITITAEPFDVLLVVTSILVTAGASQAVGTVTTTIDPTTDLGAELKALSLDRTFLIFTKAADTEFPEAAWAGRVLPADPGTITWAFKTLALITVDVLTDAEKAKAKANNVNTYTEVGGVNITQNGTMASGRFIDVRRGVDFLDSRITERVFGTIVNAPKIPFTDSGISLIESDVRAVLDTNTVGETPLLAKDPAPTTSVPAATAVDPNDKKNRILRDVKFTATLAGAIHEAKITGTVSV